MSHFAVLCLQHTACKLRCAWLCETWSCGEGSPGVNVASSAGASGAPPLQGVQERLGRLPLRGRRRVQRLC